VLLQAYPYLHIRNKEFPWGMDCPRIVHLFIISIWILVDVPWFVSLRYGSIQMR